MFKWFWTISSLGAPEVTDLSILKISVPNNITAILLELISSSQTSRFMGKLWAPGKLDALLKYSAQKKSLARNQQVEKPTTS